MLEGMTGRKLKTIYAYCTCGESGFKAFKPPSRCLADRPASLMKNGLAYIIFRTSWRTYYVVLCLDSRRVAGLLLWHHQCDVDGDRRDAGRGEKSRRL